MKAIVIDCCIVGGTCDDNINCREVLNNSMKLLVCYDRFILREYRNRIYKTIKCRNSINGEFLMMWFSELLSTFGKKVKNNCDPPGCLNNLIKRRKFPRKDVPYVMAALKCESGVIIIRDSHFLNNAERCLGILGISPLDESQGLEFLQRMVIRRERNENRNR